MNIKDLLSLKSKVILITGGIGYIGSAMSKALLEAGGTVVIADIAEKKPVEIAGGDDLAENLKVLKCDLSSTDSTREMFAKVKNLHGRIDVLINCAVYGGGAGGKKVATHSIDEMSDEIWETGIDGTLNITFRCTREVLPYFYENGVGNIINIASMYGIVSPDPGIYGTSGQNNPPQYGAAKAGVLQFTRYCAGHLAGKNIRVNSITPGPFPNPKGDLTEDFKQKLHAKTMMGRAGRPEELAGALILLASDASSYMTGSNIIIDGGWTAW